MISRKETQNLKMQYGMWLGLSKEARKSAGLPVDQDEFAKHIDVTPKTLSTWKTNKDPIVIKSRDNAKNLFLEHARFDVYNALIKSATDTDTPKSAQDRRTFFQITGELSKQPEKGVKDSHEIKIIIEQPHGNSTTKDTNGDTDNASRGGAGEIHPEPE